MPNLSQYFESVLRGFSTRQIVGAITFRSVKRFFENQWKAHQGTRLVSLAERQIGKCVKLDAKAKGELLLEGWDIIRENFVSSFKLQIENI